MTEGVIWKHLIQFSVPMFIGLLFQQLYNTVDAMIVGKFVGHEALAAVGTTGSAINVLISLSMGLSVGTSVVISQNYGARDWDKLKKSVHTAISITLILSVVLTLAGVLLVTPLLRMMKTPADVFPEAKTYLSVYFWGLPGLLLYNMGSSILRAVGDSRRPLYFLILSALTNVVGDLLFVLIIPMGVGGAALATILSQFLSAVLVFRLLLHTKEPYGLSLSALRIDTESLKRILAMGLPSSIQQGITSFSNVFVQSYINAFESACMAGYAAYNKIDAFILIPVQSIAMASTTFVAQNCGAQNHRRARKGVNVALGLSTAITMFLAIVVILLRYPLLNAFNEEAEIISYGARFILWVSPFYVLLCVNQIYAGALRGVGQAKTPMIIMLVSFVGFRQLCLYFNSLIGGSLAGTVMAYPMGWLLCSLLLAIFYRLSILGRAASLPDNNAP